MSIYELNILFPNIEKDFQEAKTEAEAVLKENNVTIVLEEDTGVKDLAYPIKKYVSGHYYLYRINAPEQSIKTIRKEFNFKEKILRFLLIRLDKVALKYFEDIKKKPLNLSSTGGWQPPSRRGGYNRGDDGRRDRTDSNSSTTSTDSSSSTAPAETSKPVETAGNEASVESKKPESTATQE